MSPNDHELLARYAATGDEAAFGELVRRHLDHVFSAAWRQTGDPHLAQDVAQSVFSDLARKARRIPAAAPLGGWLHRATRFAATDARRRNHRRSEREQEAHLMRLREQLHPEPAWTEVRPLLDEALDSLPAADRDALSLRYLEQRSLAEVGTVLGASTEAARKRVDRALDRLREALAQRGVTTTAAALGASLATQAVQAAPAGLAATLTTAALTSAAGGGAGFLASLSLMGTSSKLTVALSLTLVTAGFLGPLLRQAKALASAQAAAAIAGADAGTRPGDFAGIPARPPEAVGAASAVRETPTAELGRLRRETDDLLVRRAELRRRLQSVRAAAPPGTTPRGDTIQMAELRDAGAGTPTALLETHLWALLRGDTNRISQLWLIDPGTRPGAVQGKLEELHKAMVEDGGATRLNPPFSEVRMLRDYPADGGDRWLATEMIGRGGEVIQRMAIRVRPVDGAWRVVMGPNVEPVEEGILDPAPDTSGKP